MKNEGQLNEQTEGTVFTATGDLFANLIHISAKMKHWLML